MLILSNEEIESFLSIATCIDALEKAYKSWDKGTAINVRVQIWSCPLPMSPAFMLSSLWKRGSMIRLSSRCASTPTSSVGGSKEEGF